MDGMKMYVVQIGALSDSLSLVCVLLILECKCELADIATRPFIVVQSKERLCSLILSASGFQASLSAML